MSDRGIRKNDRIEVTEGSYVGQTGKVVSTADRPLMRVRLDNGESGMIVESALRRLP